MLFEDDDALTRMNRRQISKCGRREPVRRVKQDGKGMGFGELVETLLGDPVCSQTQSDGRMKLGAEIDFLLCDVVAQRLQSDGRKFLDEEQPLFAGKVFAVLTDDGFRGQIGKVTEIDDPDELRRIDGFRRLDGHARDECPDENPRTVCRSLNHHAREFPVARILPFGDDLDAFTDLEGPDAVAWDWLRHELMPIRGRTFSASAIRKPPAVSHWHGQCLILD